LRIFGISGLVLIPVYWHRRIEAGDLASHVYNAWLVQLIRRGEAPGLWIARQSYNVLFDVMLSSLAEIFGLRAAERIAVSLAVLIFFWGAFTLAAAASRRAPWSLAPVIAVFAYGWTFEMGLMNYYLSLGLSFFALAAFWRWKGGKRLLPFLLVPLIWMAHPLGVVWVIGAAGYIFLSEQMLAQRRRYLPLAIGFFLILAREFLVHSFPVEWPGKAFYLYNGADQLVLFGSRYYFPAGLLIVFALAALAVDVASGERGANVWPGSRVPLELFGVVAMTVALLPSSVALPQFGAPISLLTQRATSILGILACCILGNVKPRSWHCIGAGVIAFSFFFFLYPDTGKLNRMEEQVERAVAALPPGRQVLSGRLTPRGSRIVAEHIVDRACIGHCFSFGNFEARTGQFRVRAAPGNFFVIATPLNSSAEQSDRDAAQSLVSPAFEIDLCGRAMNDVCVRDLAIPQPTPAHASSASNHNLSGR
jgi:hypothetical protein